MSHRAREVGRASCPGKEFRIPYKQGGYLEDLVQVRDSIQFIVFDRSL